MDHGRTNQRNVSLGNKSFSGARGCWVVSVSNWGENISAVAVKNNGSGQCWKLGGPGKDCKDQERDDSGVQNGKVARVMEGMVLAAVMVVPFIEYSPYLISFSLSA